jgi:hypothetical protein
MDGGVTFHQRSIHFKFISGLRRQVIEIVGALILPPLAAAADGCDARLPPFEFRG